ncbi:MAG: small subunit ribosomal protein S4e [Candidatus Woesearchaeota archaeon]|nr:small subunit ribosomal protein S4e [Candidatus Woesearchaeota archaeon]MDN5327988.1 small subunit ribosomal protein S4e [Candidatus Woesearchaeota archaeon]
MVKYHLKRLAAPKTWNILRKAGTFIVRPFPSGTGLQYSMPISVWLREVLKIAKDGREVFYLLKEKKVLVNSKNIYSKKAPVGIFDVISFPELNKHYRVILNKRGKLTAIEIPEDEANLKVLKLINKTKLKGDRLQLNFNDGTNMFATDDLKTLKPGSSIVFDLKEKKVKEVLPLSEDALVYILSGAHVGSFANVKEVENSKVKIKLSDSSIVEIPLKNLIVVGQKDKPAISLRGDSNGN